MKIIIENINKSFPDNQVIKNFSLEINSNKPLAVIGANGSGKSTLIKIIAGIMSYDSGNIKYFANNHSNIYPQNVYKHTAFLATYLDLIEEFNLIEILNFHSKFVDPIKGLSLESIIDIMAFKDYKNKLIKDFSTGMKQKLKIALCLFFKKNILIFDEPCSNLDKSTIDWYKQMLDDFLLKRLLIICSNNNEFEYSLCKDKVLLH